MKYSGNALVRLQIWFGERGWHCTWSQELWLSTLGNCDCVPGRFLKESLFTLFPIDVASLLPVPTCMSEIILFCFVLVMYHQILTQEDWNKVLYNGMASTSSWAALYFIALMTFGNYVLFNLLVAILVEGFQTEVKLRLHIDYSN